MSTPPGIAGVEELPLAGVRVIELGRFAAGPACATMLADWGADVVKIEPPAGDPARGPGAVLSSPDEEPPANPRFDVHNRNRRGIVLDLSRPEGRAAFDRMLDGADVFVTNVSPTGLEHLDIDLEELVRAHPRLIVAQVSGYDLDGSQARQRSYDHGAFWSYAGVASQFADGDGVPPQPTGGMGDRATGSILAGAVTAALFARERTGKGRYVKTSLVNTGMWLMASDVADIVATGAAQRHADRRQAHIPTINCFRTADGRWLWLQLMVPEPHWRSLLAALDAEWLDDDPRFRDGDSTLLRRSNRALIELLDEIFRSRPLHEWAQRLTDEGLTWAPVRSLEEAVNDPEIRNSSAFVEIGPAHRTHLSVNTPCTFVGHPGRVATASPLVGEHTAEVLRDYGFSDEEAEAIAASAQVAPAAL
jgi:crotonobetainyl-CoA:carnitine CoA-transferase CaiB-like acyl-CoA transferase